MFFHFRHLLPFVDLQNLLRYVTVRSAFAAITAFLFSVLIGPAVIHWLRRIKVGEVTDQGDSAFLNKAHAGKKNTPTMGGLLIIYGVACSMLLWCQVTEYTLLAMVVFLCLGAVGFYDDYRKLESKGKKPFKAKPKMAFILSVCIFVVWLLYQTTGNLMIHIPFLKGGAGVLLPVWLYLVFGVLVLVGTCNAVNLTDGLDGLAAGCALMLVLALIPWTYFSGHKGFSAYLNLPYLPGVQELTVFCAALAGAIMGFLWYNCHPAQIFMGDTGSLSIGGALAFVALSIQQEFLLVFGGLIFVAEALSVMLQVGSFKLTGKRLFSIAPFHHALEMKGWAESKIIVRLWILAAICGIFALIMLKLR